MPKYRVLPGREPVRLASLDGSIIIIGETLRPVPEQFIPEARAAGCLTEEEFERLKEAMFDGDQQQPDPDAPHAADPLFIPPANPLPNADEKDDDFPTPPGTPATVEQVREGKIKAAIIEALNTGNPTDLTTGGAPKVEVLNQLLGFEVTGQERDSLYAAVIKG